MAILPIAGAGSGQDKIIFNDVKADLSRIKRYYDHSSRMYNEAGVRIITSYLEAGNIEDLIEEIFENSRFSVCPCHAAIKRVLEERSDLEYTPKKITAIRFAIAEDIMNHVFYQGRDESLKTYYTLDNTILNGLEAEEKAVCIEYAQKNGHPYIYQPADRPLAPSDISFNFLWVNLNPQNRIRNCARHIFGEGVEPTDHLEKLARWADHYPAGNMNLWYDSALVTEQAKNHTLAELEALSLSKGVSLQLRDVRKLPLTKLQREALHPVMPIYFRVDLLKALIPDFLCKDPALSATYIAMLDEDITPMPVEHFFNQRVITFLSEFGYVLNGKSFSVSYENSLAIFDKTHTRTVECFKKEVINRLDDLLSRGMRVESYTVFAQYKFFVEKMEGKDYPVPKMPRIIADCPRSQFESGLIMRPKEAIPYESADFMPGGPFTLAYGGRLYDPVQMAPLCAWTEEIL